MFKKLLLVVSLFSSGFLGSISGVSDQGMEFNWLRGVLVVILALLSHLWWDYKKKYGNQRYTVLSILASLTMAINGLQFMPLPALHHVLFSISMMVWITTHLLLFVSYFQWHYLIRLFFAALLLTELTFPLKLPWTYAQDLTSYLLNILYFPIFITGIAFLLNEILSKRTMWSILLSLIFIYTFPMRVASKLCTGALPPNWFSGFVFLIFITTSFFLVFKFFPVYFSSGQRDP